MGTCPAVRLGAAAVVGYALGGISGNATVAWLLAAAAVVTAYAWGRVRSRRSGTSCGLGLRCGPSPAEGQRSLSGSADAIPVAGLDAGADAGSGPATLGEPARR